MFLRGECVALAFFFCTVRLLFGCGDGWVGRFQAENGVYPYPTRYFGIITLAGNSPQNTFSKELRYQNP
jgi:hypothetical protein